MRILLANKYFYPRGGDCIYTIGLKNLLEKNGHDVAIFAMNHNENIENKYSKFWPDNIEYNNFRFSDFLKKTIRPFGSSEVILKFTQLIDTFSPDIVHLNNIHTQLSPVIAKIAFRKNIPVVWTLHDYKLICPSYQLLLKQHPCELCLKNKINVIKNKCIKSNFLASSLGFLEAIKWSKNPVQKYTNIFISPSEFLKNKMVSGGFNPSKIQVLHNFLAKKVEQAKFNHDLKYYCYIGRISTEKGIETLLTAAESLPQFHLLIIGDGSLLPEMKRKYNRDHISFLGFKKWEEISSILSSAQFTVLPSEWYENNPLSAIESLAHGTPVLGANIGGIPEIIQGNRNGLLFKSGDTNDLKEHIIKMFNNVEDLFNSKEISENALEKYSQESHYNKLYEIYKSAVQR